MTDIKEYERKRAIAAIHWVFSADGTKSERSMADEAINKINDPAFMPSPEPAESGAVAWIIPDWGVFGESGYRYLTDEQTKTSRDDWEDGEYDAFQSAMKGAKPLYTHPPAPSAMGKGRVTDEMVDAAQAVLLQWGMEHGSRTAARLALLTEALEWYGERARLARLIHSGGDPARFELSDDGGKRARRALSEEGML